MPSNSSAQKQDQRRRAALRRQGWSEDAIARDIEHRRAVRAAADLEAKADQVRSDAGRARNLSHYAQDVRRGAAKPPDIPAKARRWLGPCLDCGVELWVSSPRPRVPLCDRCKDKRVRKASAA